ncbi:MAG: amidase family protein [Actinomycetota bacterium]|nr:amidase family protein [Actinomycetota bacterium]
MDRISQSPPPFGLASDIGGSIRVPALFCGVFGHKPSSGLVPTSGNFPSNEAGNSRLLGVGPVARRAEDLIAVLRIIAGPDGVDTTTQPAEIGDPTTVPRGTACRDRRGTSWRPISRELYDARERAAGALAAAGARIRRVRMPSWRSALLPFLARLQAGSPSTTADLVAASGGRRPEDTTTRSRRSVHHGHPSDPAWRGASRCRLGRAPGAHS